MEAVFTVLEAIEELAAGLPLGLGIIGIAIVSLFLFAMLRRLIMLGAKLGFAALVIYFVSQFAAPALEAIDSSKAEPHISRTTEALRATAHDLTSQFTKIDVALVLKPELE